MPRTHQNKQTTSTTTTASKHNKAPRIKPATNKNKRKQATPIKHQHKATNNKLNNITTPTAKSATQHNQNKTKSKTQIGTLKQKHQTPSTNKDNIKHANQNKPRKATTIKPTNIKNKNKDIHQTKQLQQATYQTKQLQKHQTLTKQHKQN